MVAATREVAIAIWFLAAVIVACIAGDGVSLNMSCSQVLARHVDDEEVAAALQVGRRSAAVLPGLEIDHDAWESFDFIVRVDQESGHSEPCTGVMWKSFVLTGARCTRWLTYSYTVLT